MLETVPWSLGTTLAQCCLEGKRNNQEKTQGREENTCPLLEAKV